MKLGDFSSHGHADGTLPPVTSIAAFSGAQDLDFARAFPYAVNARGSAVGLIGNADFTADTATGVALFASEEICAPGFDVAVNGTQIANAFAPYLLPGGTTVPRSMGLSSRFGRLRAA